MLGEQVQHEQGCIVTRGGQQREQQSVSVESDLPGPGWWGQGGRMGSPRRARAHPDSTDLMVMFFRGFTEINFSAIIYMIPDRQRRRPQRGRPM